MTILWNKKVAHYREDKSVDILKEVERLIDEINEERYPLVGAMDVLKMELVTEAITKTDNEVVYVAVKYKEGVRGVVFEPKVYNGKHIQIRMINESESNNYMCPKSILELLTPTEDGMVHLWRETCWETVKRREKWSKDIEVDKNSEFFIEKSSFSVPKDYFKAFEGKVDTKSDEFNVIFWADENFKKNGSISYRIEIPFKEMDMAIGLKSYEEYKAFLFEYGETADGCFMTEVYDYFADVRSDAEYKILKYLRDEVR